MSLIFNTAYNIETLAHVWSILIQTPIPEKKYSILIPIFAISMLTITEMSRFIE